MHAAKRESVQRKIVWGLLAAQESLTFPGFYEMSWFEVPMERRNSKLKRLSHPS